MTYTLYHGDCLDILPTLAAGSVDAVIVDLPYPDYHTELYKFNSKLIDYLNLFNCRQFCFWSVHSPFPVDYTAVHVWNKKIGIGIGYEYIYERNGGSGRRVFSHYIINSPVAASYTGDIFYNHPSQKPEALMIDLVLYGTNPGDTVLDFTMGSGTTGVACMKTGRNFIGIELDADYFRIAETRIKNAAGEFVRTDKEREVGQLALFGD